jgi:hypothetical protein
MYVTYFGGLVVIVVGFFSAGVVRMAALTVWCTQRSTGRLMAMLVAGHLLAAVLPIAAWVPMQMFPSLRRW